MIPTLGKITPYPEQWEVAQNAIAHAREQLSGKIKPSPSYIDAYVSAGKTIIAGVIANHCQNVGARLLVLARTGELVEQNADEIFNMDAKCSVFSASLNRKSTWYSTVVGSEGSVANALSTAFTKWIPHFILIDECHQVDWEDVIKGGDKCYSKILNHFKVLNPKVVIMGMSGSPYRGIESIKGPLWLKVLEPKINRKFLVDNGRIVPTIFGVPEQDVGYDLSEFDNFEEVGTKDFSIDQLKAMHKKMDLKLTQRIMFDVMHIVKDRLCVLVTCSGLKHCKEAASVVPKDQYAIITDKTGKKERRQILSDAKKGKLNDSGGFRYKYIFQVGCLTTGVNVTIWDTSVLLRRIGSLTLLTQLLGRGMRLLKDFLVDSGYVKHDHLTLDYSGTMAAMHEMFDDPMLEDAVLQKDKDNGDVINCQKCGTENGEHARRCRGEDPSEKDGRCSYFWKSRICEDLIVNGLIKSKGCGAENDIAARVCRVCDNTLIDPNAKLTHKSYGEHDWKAVLRMEVEVIGNTQNGIGINYYFDVYDENGTQEIARVKYWAINSGGKRTWESNFIRRHINDYGFQRRAMSMSPFQVLENRAMFDIPTAATHRVNDKGQSIVHGLKFNSGRELKGGKRVA